MANNTLPRVKGDDCPEIYLKDDCIVVQGKRLAEIELADFNFAED